MRKNKHSILISFFVLLLCCTFLFFQHFQRFHYCSDSHCKNSLSSSLYGNSYDEENPDICRSSCSHNQSFPFQYNNFFVSNLSLIISMPLVGNCCSYNAAFNLIRDDGSLCIFACSSGYATGNDICCACTGTRGFQSFHRSLLKADLKSSSGNVKSSRGPPLTL